MKVTNEILQLLDEKIKELAVYASDQKMADKILAYLKKKKIDAEDEDQGDFILIQIDISKLQDSEIKKLSKDLEKVFNVDVNIVDSKNKNEAVLFIEPNGDPIENDSYYKEWDDWSSDLLDDIFNEVKLSKKQITKGNIDSIDKFINNISLLSDKIAKNLNISRDIRKASYLIDLKKVQKKYKLKALVMDKKLQKLIDTSNSKLKDEVELDWQNRIKRNKKR